MMMNNMSINFYMFVSGSVNSTILIDNYVLIKYGPDDIVYYKRK